MGHGSGRSPGTEQCESLFELSTGGAAVTLGRLLRGHDAGRLVTLRRVTGQESALAPLVDISRSIAHPRLTKVLGIARAHGESYLASEYIPGVSLSELRQAVILRGRALPADVAVRVIVDALRAVVAAQRVLREVTGVDAASANLFAEHVCVAEYGETLLTEVGVAAHLTTSPEASPADDVRTACSELYALVTAHPFEAPWRADGAIPPSLQVVLERALDQGPHAFGSVEALLHELADSPSIPLSSEDGVSVALQAVVGDLLDTRRGKLDLVERASARRDDADESTQFFRAAEFAALQERDTARPPANSAESSSGASPPPAIDGKPSFRPARPAGDSAPHADVEAGPPTDGDEPTRFWERDALTGADGDPPAHQDSATAAVRPPSVARWLFLLAVLLLLLALLVQHFEG